MTLRLAPLLLLALLGAAAERGAGPSAAGITEETRRMHRLGDRVLSVWWLPVEYWVAAARELGKPGDEIDQIRALLRSYAVLAVVDARVGSDGKLQFADSRKATERIALVRQGSETRAVAHLDPELSRRLPELAYFMSVSLGLMAPGLRLVILPNVDGRGEPLVSASRPGELVARYQADGEDPVALRWRVPLTSVVGPTRCPKGGEELEASWAYCPWHGVPLR